MDLSGDSSDIKARRLALIQSMSSSIPPAVYESTVVIVAANAPNVRQIGTGTLFCVADRAFVITAGHVVREARKRGSGLGISGGNSHFIATAGTWITSTGDDSGNDHYDVSVYALDDRQVSKLAGKKFLRLQDVTFSDDLLKGFFVIFGFPQIWATASGRESETMLLKGFEFSTFAYLGDTTGLAGFDARYHLLLEAQHDYLYDQAGEEISFRTRFNTPARLPDDLRGVSGCSVWQIGDLRTSVHQWSSASARLVGVQTGVYPSRGLIKATKWIAPSTLLYSAFPEIRKSFEVHGITRR